MKIANTFVIVTPVRDEVAHIERTLESVVRQSRRPAQWVIVDDGSTDGTGPLLDKFESLHSWISIVHRSNRGFRAAGGGVMDSFYAGFAAIHNDTWDFVVKLDGDLSFAPDYFEKCLEHFANEPTLGVGGGTVCSQVDGELHVDSVGDPPFHVRGATKIYRRACWDQIAPLIKAPGWDTLDEVRANFFGWRTRTFPQLKLVQHKPTGSADGSWANSFKNGKANYITGYHPAFMLGKCAKRVFRKPYLVEAAGLCVGFLSGYFRRLPQLADAETIRYLRQQQVRHLFFRTSIYG
jgi:poly-beta-1,6-N-acetyl-D-glucosamine synthase